MRQMKLGAFIRSAGHHVAAWRDPQADANSDVSFPYYVQLAKIAERGLFDMLFMADVLTLPHHSSGVLSRTSYVMRPDPFTIFAGIAAVTTHIGLVCTSTTTYDEPYHIARRFATLDHLSGGRSGWNLVTSVTPAEATNFNRDAHAAPAERYRRAREFAEVVRGLWDSWDDDAFLRDKESGVFFNEEKMHVLNHDGTYFRVRGPLNVARSPQGRPIMVQAGSSDDGRALAAETADIVFTGHQTLKAAQAFYSDVKARTVACGRAADDLKIMPGVFVTVSRTEGEAQAIFDRLQALIDPKVGLMLLTEFIGFDMSGYLVDGPLPELPERLRGQSRPELLFDLARRENLTIRQLYMRIAGGRGHLQVLGSPTQIADTLEEWFTAGAADGFNIMPSVLPSGLDDFVTLVIPELQRRGIFRTRYEGRTLRENLGLPWPKRQSTCSPQLAT